MEKPIFLASDHAGVSLKAHLVEKLTKEMPGFCLIDLGPISDESVDYPDFAMRVAKEVTSNKGKGILICGSGLGMCMSANKAEGVRAVSAWDVTSARLARLHNDANIVCLGARLLGSEVALDIAKVFLSTEFEGGRHQKRIDKITALEKGSLK